MANENIKTLEITDVTDDVIFDAIYDEYKMLVMNTCLSVLKNKQLAEDAFQSTFISVAQNIYKLKGTPERVKRFITKTARNAAIDIYRKNLQIMLHEIPIISDEERKNGNYGNAGVSVNELTVESFEEEIFRQYERNELLAVMDEMDDKSRMIIRDFYFDDLGIHKMAEKYGISEAAARKRIQRSYEKLKKKFLRRIKKQYE